MNFFSKFKLIIKFFIFSLFVFLINSCAPSNEPSGGIQENLSKILSGRVVDYDGKGISGVNITVDNQKVTTDQNGFFKISNLSINSKDVYIIAEKFDFLTTYKRIPKSEQATLFTLILKPKQLTARFNSNNGIVHFYDDGSRISIPRNSIMFEDTKNQYNGEVLMYSFAVPGGDEDLPNTFPGDFRAQSSSGNTEYLYSHGIQRVELFSPDGKKLNLLSGAKAKMTFLVPDAIKNNPPDEFPVWHFNKVTGIWEETGKAILKGDFYETEVSHFSIINLDFKSNVAKIVVKVVDCDNKPLSGVTINLLTGQGTTDATGEITFMNVPTRMTSSQYAIIRIEANSISNGFLLSNTRIISDLKPDETRTVTIKMQSTSLKGRLVDCNNNPMTGLVQAFWGTNGSSYGYTDLNGNFIIQIPVGSNINVVFPYNYSVPLNIPSSCIQYDIGSIKLDPSGKDCGGNNNPSTTDCDLNWTFMGQTYNANNFKINGFKACGSYSNNLLTIRGMINNNMEEGLIVAPYTNITGIGSYKIGVPKDGNFAVYVAINGKYYTSWYSSIDKEKEINETGTLIISKITDKEISGTFNCTLFDSSLKEAIPNTLSGSFRISIYK